MDSIVWSELALADLAELHFAIAGDSVRAADQLLDSIDRALELLAATPEAGRLRRFSAARARGVRSWRLDDFPNHLIFYRVRKKTLYVERLLHGARDLDRLF